MDYADHAETAYALVKRHTGIPFTQPQVISNPHLVAMYAQAGKISPDGEMAFVPGADAVIIGPNAGQMIGRSISSLPLPAPVRERMREMDALYMLTHELTHAAIHAVRPSLEVAVENFPLFIRDEGACEYIATQGMRSIGSPLAEGVIALHNAFHEEALAGISYAPVDTEDWRAAARRAVKTKNGLIRLKYALGWKFAMAVEPADIAAFAAERVTFEDLIDPQSYLRTRSYHRACPSGRSS